MMVFNPANWYWSADDGRIFSSAKLKTVPAKDADLATWKALNGEPGEWPRDDTGTQTDAALQAVLTPYGLTMNGSPPIAPLTFMGFLALFSADEQTAIVSSDNPQIRLFCLMAAGANGVDLSDPRTVAGTTQLETLKLIAKGRAKQVLAGQTPPAAGTAA